MTLRRRLVLSVLALLALSLVGAAIATFATVRGYITHRTDDQLTAVSTAVEKFLADQRSTHLASVFRSDGDQDTDRLWQALSDSDGFPSFFQIRGPDGEIVQTIAPAGSPEVPSWLAPHVKPNHPTGEIFAGAYADGDGDGKDDSWRLRAALLWDGESTLIVGMPMSGTHVVIKWLAIIQMIVTVVVLGGVAFVAARMIRRGLRPLEEIAVTASAIGGGDLSRRVRVAGPRTEIGRLGLALNAMVSQLESAFGQRQASEARLRRFVGDASHELRTPIASIRGYAELFRRGAATRPDDLAKALARIEAEAERMGKLVDEMLLLARLDEGRPLRQEPVDLTELAEDAVTDALAVEPDRPVRLEADDTVVVIGDADRLRQVLANLLANVRQHTPPEAPAVVRVAVEDGFAVLDVVDSGPGLTDGQRAQVFERFYRVAGSRFREHGGAGLGLSIVAAVVEAHGGEASVSPTPGGGATFQIRIPAGE